MGKFEIGDQDIQWEDEIVTRGDGVNTWTPY